MKTPALIALVAGTLFGNAVRAQHVLFHVTPTSYEREIFSTNKGGGDWWARSTGASPVHPLPSWRDADFASHKTDYDHRGRSHDRDGGSKFYVPPRGNSTGRPMFGKLGGFENDEREGYGRPDWGLNHHNLPADCSPIPEPPIYPALLGAAAFGLAVWRRGRRVN